MDLYGCHFEYAGELSRKYGIFIANVTTERNLLIAGKTQSVSVFNKRNQLKHDLGSIYSEAPLTFDMEVVSESTISGEWRRKIQKWLFNQRGYQKLYIDRADEFFGEVFNVENGVPSRMYLNCKFVNPEKIEGNGGIAGYKFTVECDSHMAWQDPIKKGYLLPGGAETVTTVEHTIDTDFDDYTYPRVTMTIGNLGGAVSVTNITDERARATSFSSLDANSVIVLNGAFNFVSEGCYERFIDRNFPRLLDGKNTIQISGDVVSLEIEWQNKRYL